MSRVSAHGKYVKEHSTIIAPSSRGKSIYMTIESDFGVKPHRTEHAGYGSSVVRIILYRVLFYILCEFRLSRMTLVEL